MRAFFSFCMDSGWIDKNPAAAVRAPQAKVVPTLPFSASEWKDILTALDVYGEIHFQSPVRVRKQLRALFLLMRYSGLRISDAVRLARDRIDGSGICLSIKRRPAIRYRFPSLNWSLNHWMKSMSRADFSFVTAKGH